MLAKSGLVGLHNYSWPVKFSNRLPKGQAIFRIFSLTLIQISFKSLHSNKAVEQCLNEDALVSTESVCVFQVGLKCASKQA